ncbi:uncharacterized protein LOC126404539 [Scomber scombrus]|uniref:Uncharacterized protein LOC126404539 n=1 Tax=Scomber scombrus TaxID=13677 RepID=A0AAV1PW76_SCOSC
MKVILLTSIIFALVVVHGGQRPPPCGAKRSTREYIDFIWKHILQTKFPRNSIPDWENHFRTFNLRCRERKQSFIEQADLGQVQGICSSAGRFLRDNLCISRSTMLVYDVISDMNTCNILSVTPSRHYVIVACYNVENICRPTHYEPYNKKDKPGNKPCI